MKDNKIKINDFQIYNDKYKKDLNNNILNNITNKKVIKLNNINELKQILVNINNNSIPNSNDSSIYYVIGANDEEENNNNNESGTSISKTSQIVKVKGKKMTEITDRNILNQDNSFSKFNNSNLSSDSLSSSSSSSESLNSSSISKKSEIQKILFNKNIGNNNEQIKKNNQNLLN